ncbi:type IV pilus modification PilV family protein [Deinococcus koreensis]|uniref:type IV pilus modification PilV family protein n=1 Tax=Deinococcus koreensis TaxID=2054903 RepID=UPI0013FDA9AB|nr:prepilin-type N-terminal cleavage/methylation domain-containing protein [Deinococcus koreensis]
MKIPLGAARRQQQQAGFSIVEVLVALSVSAILITSLSSLLLTSIRSDGASRARTTVDSVTESWLDRYRARQEPLGSAGSVCSGNSSSFTCTYPVGHNYSLDGIYSHSASASSMSSRFGGYRNVITGTRLQAGTSQELWQITVQVRDDARKQTMEVSTYVLQ